MFFNTAITQPIIQIINGEVQAKCVTITAPWILKTEQKTQFYKKLSAPHCRLRLMDNFEFT